MFDAFECTKSTLKVSHLTIFPGMNIFYLHSSILHFFIEIHHKNLLAIVLSKLKNGVPSHFSKKSGFVAAQQFRSR
jgi:hypothetical protein